MRSARTAAWLLGAFALCAVAAIAVGTASARPAATATNTTTYQDSTGDAGGAPDVSTVVVSNDNDGLISFALDFTNRQSFGAFECVWIDVDSDNNMASGYPALGFDYDIQYCGGRVSLWRWNGQDFVSTSMTSLRSDLAGSKLTVYVSAAELGQTSKLAFGVSTTSNSLDENAPYDLAPERPPFWTYEVKLAPVVTVAALDVTPQPAVPGKTLTAKAKATVTRAGKAEALPAGAQVVWTAKLGSTTLAQTSAVAGADGTLTATWKMPASTKATEVVIDVSVTTEGVTATKSQSVKVLYVAPKLRVTSIDCTPEPGVAGKVLTGRARVVMTRGGVPEALPATAKATWSATIGGVRLKPLSARIAAGGNAVSTWKLPKFVTAKAMKVTVVITAEGVRTTATHMHRIR